MIGNDSKEYVDRRSDNKDRWEFIREYVDDADHLLDIGCAQGYFTVQPAKENDTVTIGIDLSEDRLESAIKRHSFPEKAGFMKWNISPEDIYKIPSVDVILFLTVHHHWELSYDLEKSEEMFQVLLDRCDTLVYEPPGDRPIIHEKRGIMDPNDNLEYYRGRLNALYGDNIKIKDFATFTRYEHEERYDPLFIIDSSNFSL